ncbi:MAG TPA: SIS domain-containing protein [Actinophytocola sp.]|uniref:SIS domain-containing protein n=1 Tax=Actinophytocola sp. TaxID=1872138 RepID=UPI002DB78A37|nr:SIS domain-containing protein [Actinophytocola sp.]HEU5472402.1 SIS domain-containing protein [Actinophytocola sp.]
MNVSAQTYATEILRLLEQLTARSMPAIEAAAALFADCVRADGVIHAFGTGHSQATALEIAGRAGGLIPTNRISLADLVIAGGQDPSVLDDPMLERQAHVAAPLFELAAPRPGDLFVIASNSGVNGSVVELAHLATAAGHKLIAITSLEHSRQATPKHESGKRLNELADVTLDTGAPFGDAILSMPDGATACAVSSVTASVLVQMVVAEAIRRLLDDGSTPPVYISSNVPGGHDRNLGLEKHYAGRIRRMAY